MSRMESYSMPLRIHRKSSLHIDPLFCGECCELMERGMDRARYMGKALLPGNPAKADHKELLAQKEGFEVHYNEDNTIHHITVLEHNGQLRPAGKEWMGLTAVEAARLDAQEAGAT